MLTDALKQMLNGLAHANAGEYMSQREKTSLLGQATADSTAEIEATGPIEAIAGSNANARHIAMYMGSELPAEVMDYVIETCASLKNDLTVLTLESKNVSAALLQPYEAVLAEAGINMQVAKLNGDPVSGLSRYLRKHPEVAFLACKDNGYLGRRYLNGTQPNNALPVPVVVVATGKSAATQTHDSNKVSAA